ncbi:MAG: M20 family metallopeptidase [Myxococcota bacterium]|nr:amidohydrolase [Myxococcota bacterium]
MLVALAVHVSLAAGVSTAEVDKVLSPKLASLVATYEDLHAHPELSEKEAQTSAKLAAKLKTLGYAVTTGVGLHGVVAILKNGDGPTLLVRADMDALPVTEDTGLTYASTTRGVMHACGHDVHMTSLLGTAEVMARLKDRWRGTLMLIGQSAEEVGKGAKAMLSAGLYEKFAKPTYALALHVDAGSPMGVVSTRSGYVLANVDSVDITVRGVGGHGAAPEMAKDPIVMASELVMTLQTLVSRELSPGEPGVVTVGSFHGGTKHNIIPDEVKLQLTVRSYGEAARKLLLDGIARIANGVAAAHGVPADRMPVITNHPGGTPATYNDPELTERLTRIWIAELGESTVKPRAPRMTGEDFGRFSLPDHSVPAVFFFVGATDPKLMEHGKAAPSEHSSRFAPVAEVVIKRGVQATVVAATALLQAR